MEIWKILAAWVLLAAIQVIETRFCILPRIWARQQRLFWRPSLWRDPKGWTPVRDQFFAFGYAAAGFVGGGGMTRPLLGVPAALLIFMLAVRLGGALSRLVQDPGEASALDETVWPPVETG